MNLNVSDFKRFEETIAMVPNIYKALLSQFSLLEELLIGEVPVKNYDSRV